MNKKKYTYKDYPISEKYPETVKTKSKKPLSDLTIENLINEKLTMEDFRISEESLIAQAEIAESIGRYSLAKNFRRGAEMVRLPQNEIFEIYEKLRPGRAKSKGELISIARKLKEKYHALILASFVEEAADIYEKRDLFNKRY